MEVIKVDRLSKSFGKVEVLKDISLTYRSGIIYGMVGENGAGKTTLFNCLTGLYTYNGTIGKAPGIKVGYLPADPFFYSLITGIEYIEFCMKAKGYLPDKEKIKQMNAVFQLPLSRYASEYSTGMKKKLAFMALRLQENDLYILDEPFNGVDLKGCIELKKCIRSLKTAGRTVIISSHLISILHELCDCIDYLSDHTLIKRYVDEDIATIEKDILEG